MLEQSWAIPPKDPHTTSSYPSGSKVSTGFFKDRFFSVIHLDGKLNSGSQAVII